MNRSNEVMRQNVKMLMTKGHKYSKRDIKNSLLFALGCYPKLGKHGSVDFSIWENVGKATRDRLDNGHPVPPPFLPMWSTIQQTSKTPKNQVEFNQVKQCASNSWCTPDKNELQRANSRSVRQDLSETSTKFHTQTG